MRSDQILKTSEDRDCATSGQPVPRLECPNGKIYIYVFPYML